MSEDLFYPDNQARASRVTQLIENCQTLSSYIEEKDLKAQQTKKDINDEIEKGLAKRGLSNVEQMSEGARKVWGPEVREQYKEMMRHAQTNANFLVPQAEILTYVAALAGAVGIGAKIVEVFQYGTAIMTSRLIVQGVLRLTAGHFTAGAQLLRNSVNISRVLPYRVRQTVGLKAIKAAKFAGKAIPALAFIVDGGVSIFSAFAGARHREDLQRAIKDLGSRRFSVKYIVDLFEVYRDFFHSIHTVVSLENGWKEDLDKGDITEKGYKNNITRAVDKLVDNLKMNADRVTFESVWKGLAKLDADNHAWTNEDMSENGMRKLWESGDIQKYLHGGAQAKAKTVDIEDDPIDHKQEEETFDTEDDLIN